MEDVVKELKIIENHWDFNGKLQIEYFLKVVFSNGLSSYIGIKDTKAIELIEKGIKMEID
jgi:hypothetical protein